jgi:hypothetical protein
MAKRVVRAPKNGRVLVAGGGQVLLELETAPYELKAAIPGTVENLVEDRGAIIEAIGALIQGVWGNGRTDYGVMSMLLNSSDDVLTPDRLDVSLRGSIILGGYCENPDVLKTAAGLPLRGLILSSMDAQLLPLAEKLRIPIIVLEGYGHRRMNSAAYKLLTTNERREVAINAQAWDPARGTRPEIIIPLPATVEPVSPQETENFNAGKQVRLIRAPYEGSLGSIVEVRPGMTTLPSGVTAPAAEIQLENGEKMVLPLANLEIIA